MTDAWGWTQVLMIISRSKPHREMFLEIGGVRSRSLRPTALRSSS